MGAAGGVYNALEDTYRLERLVEIANPKGGDKRKYQVKNTQLVTTQLFFDSSILVQIRDLALKSGFTLETQLIQSFQQKYFSDSPDNTYVLNVPRKSIRSVKKNLFILFLGDDIIFE